ncbi:hypothetical protein J5226_04925 [Lysobacter sp. K5869]|uniref:hypothetical protein n=1 Tax=Lysobacter sp. K5869 TaxID=2820808 RepID=UPI001C0628E5|nr:hypothetical protein [Lysobacter sp. K5869]QWP77761.1 hypothetical protein J5226_04925 [Lysobacter sp. K5869]
MAELFRNRSACLRANSLDVDAPCLVVSFAPWSGRPNLDALGWAEKLCESQRWPALHVISADDDWYQSDGAQEAVERAAGIARRYPRVVTYGSSMGGYAALNFANDLRARIAFAVAPQFSIDRAKVGFETRWAAEAGRTTFLRDRVAAISPRVRPVLVYDPWFAPDVRHIEAIAAHCEPVRVPLPLMGHDGVGGRVLKPMLAAAREDAPWRMREDAIARHRRERKHTATYYLQLVERGRSLSPQARLELLRRAHALEPTHVGVALKRSTLLLAGGCAEAALDVQQEALRHASPAFFATLTSHRAQALAALGREAEALAAARQAREAAPHNPFFAHHLAQLLGRAGQWPDALRHQRAALASHPGHPAYSQQLAALERAAAAATVAPPSSRSPPEPPEPSLPRDPERSRLGEAAAGVPAPERERMLAQACAVEPSYSGAAARFSSALLVAGYCSDALAVQDEALERIADTPLLLSHRAQALERLGRPRAALAAIARAVALAPDNAWFRHQYAGLLLAAGDWRKAEREQLAALERAPAQAGYRERLQRIRERSALAAG